MNRRRSRRPGMALYMAVMSSAVIASTLGLAALLVVRIERRQVTAMHEMVAARTNARSGVELGLRTIANDFNWRTTYVNGVESAPCSLGLSDAGTVSWILRDSDGDLTNADTALRLHGIGRSGTTVQVSSIGLDGVGPQQLRAMNSILSLSTGEVDINKLWCQYLKPDLPQDAIAWWVTSVELYCRKKSGNESLDVRIYKPLADNMPSSVVIDQVSVNSSEVGNNWHWHTFNFSGNTTLPPSSGLCLAFMSSNGKPIELNYQNGGVLEQNTALIRGRQDGTLIWESYEPGKALRYRVHGKYLRATSRSWQHEAAP